MKHEELTKRESVMLEIIETQAEHCDWQIKRFKDEGDHESAKDWMIRSMMCEKILTKIKKSLALED